MSRNGYTTYAIQLSAADFHPKNPIVLESLVPGAPIIWEFRPSGCHNLPKCNVPATRFLHEAIAKGKSRSVRSARTYGSHLALWFRYCDEVAVEPNYPLFEDFIAFREWIQKQDDPAEIKGRMARDVLSVSGINGILSAAISYYKWAFKKHLVDWDPMLVTDRNGNLLRTNDGITQRLETNQLLLTCSARASPRNIPKSALNAILGELVTPYRLCSMFAVSCGLRASEVADLPLAALKPSVDLSDGEFIPSMVCGKGGVTAPVYVPAEVYAQLLHYRDFTRWDTVQRIRKSDGSYCEPRTLFITERYGRSFSGRTLAKAFKEANDSLGYIVERYYFHGLRHTYALSLSAALLRMNAMKRENGEPTFDVLGTVQDFMRHANPETTETYLQMGQRYKVLLAKKINDLYDQHLYLP